MNLIEGAITLLLVVVTPPGVPNVTLQLKEPSIEQCLADAKAFLDRGPPKQIEGAQGVIAACATPKSVEQHSAR